MPSFCSWNTWRKQPDAVLLDVRAPCEYALGAVPGARNYPVLDDAERHEIGTLYVRSGRHAAVSAGLELFAAKSQAMVKLAQEQLGTGRPVFVHCWRGGMRSELASLWLGALGIPNQALDGGYKSYRQDTLKSVAAVANHQLLVLDGCTGVGKTELLHQLSSTLPTLDFERLANHRGSAFGDFALTSSPSTQQNFENGLAEDYRPIAHHPRLLVEIEGDIGNVRLDPALRRRVFAGPFVMLERAFDDRVQRLAQLYAANWTEAADVLFGERCQLLRGSLSNETLAQVISAVARRDFETAVATLLRAHYDKKYAKGLAKRLDRVVARFNLTTDERGAIDFLRSQIGPLSKDSGSDA